MGKTREERIREFAASESPLGRLMRHAVEERDRALKALAQIKAEEVIELRPSVRAYAVQMELALRRNEDKGGWSHLDRLWLLNKLHEENGELIGELVSPGVIDPERVTAEAADLGNIAMMAACNYGTLPEHDGRGG